MPKQQTHSIENPTPYSIHLTRKQYQKLQAKAKERKLSIPEVIDYLLEFEKLEAMESLISSVRRIYAQGPTPIQIAQIGVVYDYLDSIRSKFGF